MGSLSVSLVGHYRVDIAFHAIRQLAASVRSAAARAQSHETVEQAAETQGYYTAGKLRMKPGKVSLWLRSHRGFESLTLEYGGYGQISLPYSAVETLVKMERRNLV